MEISQAQARSIVELDVFFDLVKLRYPDALEDMVSWKSNNNCSCGNRFLKFLNEKYKDSNEKLFLNTILENNSFIDKVKEIESKNLEAYRKRLFHGKIIKMDKSPESWENLANHLNSINAIYRSFDIIDNGSDLEIRFL